MSPFYKTCIAWKADERVCILTCIQNGISMSATDGQFHTASKSLGGLTLVHGMLFVAASCSPAAMLASALYVVSSMQAVFPSQMCSALMLCGGLSRSLQRPPVKASGML